MDINDACEILGVKLNIDKITLLKVYKQLISILDINKSSDLIIYNVITTAFNVMNTKRVHVFQQKTGEFYHDRVKENNATKSRK
jgi:hypothetical protein